MPHLPAGESRGYQWAESVFSSNNLSPSVPTQRQTGDRLSFQSTKGQIFSSPF